jgi:hypothetical protein
MTGWTFEQVRQTDVHDMERLLIYKKVKEVAQFGGNLEL